MWPSRRCCGPCSSSPTASALCSGWGRYCERRAVRVHRPVRGG
nr:MAG TPA_asm: epoxyqueuosine reductase [Caudoviricetes sp.]